MWNLHIFFEEKIVTVSISRGFRVTPPFSDLNKRGQSRDLQNRFFYPVSVNFVLKSRSRSHPFYSPGPDLYYSYNFSFHLYQNSELVFLQITQILHKSRLR